MDYKNIVCFVQDPCFIQNVKKYMIISQTAQKLMKKDAWKDNVALSNALTDGKHEPKPLKKEV